MIRWTACLLVLFTLIALIGYERMKPQDFKDKTPRLLIEDYFQGRVKAWGIFENRFGDLKREFEVTIDGAWDGEELVLDENFLYRDGEVDRRVWRIRKLDDHRYEGRADDIVGVASGVGYGNALNWNYEMILPVRESDWRVKFDDWMYLQGDGILINRARIIKWGIEVGEVTLTFRKIPG